MKKILAMILAVTLLLLTLTGCDSQEPNEPKGPEKLSHENVLEADSIPDEPEAPPEDVLPAMERITIQLDTGEVSISLPTGWQVNRSEGTIMPFTTRTYDLELVPPSGEKALGIITIGATIDGQPFSGEDFYSLYSARSEALLHIAVEDVAEYTKVMVEDGYGVYTVLTDASLVGTTPPDDEYLFLTIFHANYNSGYITYASILVDDLESESYKIMLNAVTSIEASFEPSASSLGLGGWDWIMAAPVYDLDDFDLLNHDLANSEYLMEYMLESERLGENLKITVHTAGEQYIPNVQEPDSIIWSTDGIGLLYYIVPSTGILETLSDSVTNDIRGLEASGFYLYAHLPLRVSENEQSAVFGLNVDIYGEPNVVYLYMLQEIPDTDYTLLLVLMPFYGYIDVNDIYVIRELSDLIGIDISDYIPW